MKPNRLREGWPHDPNVQVSWGELMDKISILEIKEKRLTSSEAVANVRRELALLLREAGDVGPRHDLVSLRKELRAVNEALWEIEDRIPAKEAAGTIDLGFIELPRSVYC